MADDTSDVPADKATPEKSEPDQDAAEKSTAPAEFPSDTASDEPIAADSNADDAPASEALTDDTSEDPVAKGRDDQPVTDHEPSEPSMVSEDVVSGPADAAPETAEKPAEDAPATDDLSDTVAVADDEPTDDLSEATGTEEAEGGATAADEGAEAPKDDADRSKAPDEDPDKPALTDTPETTGEATGSDAPESETELAVADAATQTPAAKEDVEQTDATDPVDDTRHKVPETKAAAKATQARESRAAIASAKQAAQKALGFGAGPKPVSATPAKTAQPTRKTSAVAQAGTTNTKRFKKVVSEDNPLVRRLRERANRGIAPMTGVPSDPVDTAPRRRAAAPEETVFEPDAIRDWPMDPSDAEPEDTGPRRGPGGGMGGGGMMGGGGGGMMGGGGGGMMGGGGGGMMGGGGMRPGMMGGGMGGMGGGMGGMGGGMGMRGGMGQQSQGGGSAEKVPGSIHLFDPQGLFKLLYILGYPLKFFIWLLGPFAIVSVLTLWQNSTSLRVDLKSAFSDVSSVAAFIIGLFVVNLVSRTIQGVAIVSQGGRVKMFGFGLVMGIVPRFVID